MARRRIDEALVALGLAESLELARALVMEGRVYQGECKALKPGESVIEGRPLSVRGTRCPYVSRGGFKLQRALEAFQIDADGRVCIDVGASTGGFTDVLLRAGAQRVYAVDVGYGQLDYKLRADERVAVMERVNARFLQPEQFEPRPSLGATDVSFISLRAVLPAALAVLEGDARFVALIKPQFEAPREQVGEKGVVRRRDVHQTVLRDIVSFVETLGWRAQGLDYSPITGPEGNIEFLADLRPAEAAYARVTEADIVRTVDAAYDKFMKL